MAKKFVRGITDVKTITNQDFDTNNVNDLLSDGQYNYIHRKKGKNEEYHNLTDNIKTLSSDNTDLLTVTNNNKTTNTATLHPKHDAQKEQVLESTRNTITINHGENGTAEKTTVDTNPQKVLEHENLISNSQYVTIEHEQDSNTTEIKTDNLVSKLDELNNKIPTSAGGRNLALGTSGDWNSPWTSFNGQNNQTGIIYSIYNRGLKVGDKVNVRLVLKYSGIVAADGQKARILFETEGNVTLWGSGSLDFGKAIFPSGEDDEVVLTATTTITENHLKNDFWYWRLRVDYIASGRIQWKEAKAETGDLPTPWSPAPEDIYSLLAQKQDVLTAGTGITIQGNTISASAPVEGATVSIQGFSTHGDFNAVRQVVTIGQKTLTTFSFELYNENTETVLSGELKEELGKLIGTGYSASNGDLTITNDGTTMKLINSTPEIHNIQHATFTFYRVTGGDTPSS